MPQRAVWPPGSARGTRHSAASFAGWSAASGRTSESWCCRTSPDWSARAAVGFHGTPVEGSRLRRGQGLAGAVMSQRESMVVPDVEADYRVEEPYLKDGSVRSMAAFPLLAGDDLLGVVAVGYRMAHSFPPDEVARLEAIVRRTAQAIERAQALDSVQRSTQGLEAQIAQQMEALQKAAADQVEANRQTQEARKQTREMEQRMKLQAAQAPQVKEVIVEREVVRQDPSSGEAARFRGEMQKTVSEELRAPLTALLDLPRLLVDGLQKPLGDTERGQLEILQERGQEILELIEGLTAMSGLQAGGLKLAKTATDLPTLVQRVVRTLQPRAAAKGNRIETDIKPGVAPVVTDARRVEQVLGNLILSAVKYTEVGEIRVSCHQRDREVVIDGGRRRHRLHAGGAGPYLPAVLPGRPASRPDAARHGPPPHGGRAARHRARRPDQVGERAGPRHLGHRHAAGAGMRA